MVFLYAVPVVIGVVLALAARKPDTFRVERSATVAAPAPAVYDRLVDFRRWTEWSPWEDVDPHLQRTYEGADRGVGAVYGWKGNSKAGAGRMEIVEADEPSKVVIDLRFLKPFKAQNVTTFALAPEGDGTRVDWVMDGPLPFPSKVMSVFTTMDKMVGKDFEKGLARLKAAAEG